MMWGFGGFGFLWMTLFWIGLILVVSRAFIQVDRAEARGQSRAMQIVEERFARGEVDAEELEARRRELAR